MSLAADIQRFDLGLPRYRSEAEGLMMIATTCRVTADGEPVWDEGSGEYVTESVTTYEGKCRLRLRDTQPQEQGQAGQFATVIEAILSLPIETSGAVKAGQTVEILTNDKDASLIGRTYRVGADLAGSLMTARRLPLEEVQPR